MNFNPADKVLALDLATQWGWASGRLNAEQPDAIGHRQIKSANLGEFIEVFRLGLREVVALTEPDIIVFESPILRGATTIMTLRKLYSMPALVEHECHMTSTLVLEEDNNRVRAKFVSGKLPRKSKERKQAVLDACAWRKWEVANDDEGDACALWWFTVTRLGNRIW